MDDLENFKVKSIDSIETQLNNKIYSIYYLREYGVSNKFIQKLIDSGITDIVDFKNKYENIRYDSNDFVNKLRYKFPDLNIVISDDTYDSIYLLNNFFESGAISDFWANKGYKKLSLLQGLSIEKLLKIPYVGLRKAQKTDKIIKMIFSGTFEIKQSFQKHSSDISTKLREEQEQRSLENEFLRLIDIGDTVDIPEKISDEFIQQQVSDKKIVIQGIKARKYYISVKEFLDFEFKHKEVLLEKISGKTLQEIGDNFQVTRERIRQILKKMAIPTTYEEYLYKEIFTQYNFTLEEFIELFQVSPEVYGILKEKLVQGKKPSYEYVWFNNFSKELKDKYLEKNNLYYSFRNKFETKYPSKLLEEILFTNPDKIYTSSLMLEELAYETNERNVLAYVARSEYAIESRNLQFRFYDNNIALEDIEKLKGIFQLPAGIYHTKKIYDLNRPLMEELELFDGYELANLLKRIGYECFSFNKLVRQAEIYIDYNDKREFFDDILLNYDNFELEEIGIIIEETYGINSTTTINYLWKEYSDFVYNNKIDMDVSKPEDEKFYSDLLKIMGAEIYTVEEIQLLIKKLTVGRYNLSQGILNKIGYTIRQSFVVRNDFSNITQAVDAKIFKNDFYEQRNQEVEKSQFFNIRLTRLQEEYKLFRISKNKYISSNRAKLNTNLLNDFLNEVIDYGRSHRWFTYYSMISNGFEHELIDLGFDDVFYESLLKTAPKLKYIPTIHPIFMVTNDPLKLERFLTEYLNECIAIDAYDMLDDIKSIYGLEISRDRAKWILRNSGTYYSEPMNKFYSTKEQYLKEIYK